MYLLAYWVVLAFVFAGAFVVRLSQRLSYLNRRAELCSMLAEGCHLRGEAIRFAHAYWAKFGDGAGFMDSEQPRLALLHWNQRVDVLMQGADQALQRLGKAEAARISAKFPYVNGEAWIDDRVNYADHLCTKLARLLHEEEREQETRHTGKKADAPRHGQARRSSGDEFSEG